MRPPPSLCLFDRGIGEFLRFPQGTLRAPRASPLPAPLRFLDPLRFIDPHPLGAFAVASVFAFGRPPLQHLLPRRIRQHLGGQQRGQLFPRHLLPWCSGASCEFVKANFDENQEITRWAQAVKGWKPGAFLAMGRVDPTCTAPP